MTYKMLLSHFLLLSNKLNLEIYFIEKLNNKIEIYLIKVSITK